MIARRNFDDDARGATFLGGLDVADDAAGEREDLRLQAEGGDVRDRGAILRRDGRHAGLDAVDAHGRQLLGDGHLLFAAEDDLGLLFTVAQRDVVHLDVLGEVERLADFRQPVPRARKPLLCLPRIHCTPLPAFNVRRAATTDASAVRKTVIYRTVQPPSMNTELPVTKDAPGEASTDDESGQLVQFAPAAHRDVA